jgi:hypothetical protein
MIEIKLAVRKRFSFNHLLALFNCIMNTTNKAGIPIAGKKLGAIPKK